MKVAVKPGFGLNLMRQRLKLLNAFKHNPNRLVALDDKVAEYLVKEGFVEYADDREQRNAQVNCEVVEPLLVAKKVTEEIEANPLWIALKEERDISDLMRKADKGYAN